MFGRWRPAGSPRRSRRSRISRVASMSRCPSLFAGSDGMTSTDRALELWPRLDYAELKDTLYAVHRWTQVVGKIRLALTPLMNHWWNSTLYVTPRGLTTSLMPTGSDALQIDFDFLDHKLVLVTSRGGRSAIPLGAMSVADLYRQVFESLARLGVPDPGILPVPVEV